MTKEAASSWLLCNAPEFRIVDWTECQNKNKFERIEDGHIFEMTFTNLKVHHKEGRKIGSFQETEESVRNWLSKNIPNVELIEWCGNSSENSKFFDKDRSLEFSYAYKQLKQGSKSGRTFRANEEEIRGKVRVTCLKRFGQTTNLKLDRIKDQIKSTNLEKYGVLYPVQNSKIKAKIKSSKIKSGLIYDFGGRGVNEFSKEKSVSKTTVLHLLKNGIDVDSYEKKKSSLETIFEEKILKVLPCNYEFSSKSIDGRKYDFIIKDRNIILECNGLYWHSEDNLRKKNFGPTYHKDKMDHYSKNGFRSYFFNEDEIENKTAIVKSILSNALRLNEKIGARKCNIEQTEVSNSKVFLNENHLMGSGSGRTYSLVFEEKIVAAIQVKWRSIKDKQIEISRFCTKNGISVAGGFSKLLNHVIKEESPNSIVTFIDRRYGVGEYLKELGFEKKSEHVSFKWTNYKKTFHRMKFPGNTGYENGMTKIWDCGQAKWELQIKK